MYRKLLVCLVFCLVAVVVYTRNVAGDDSIVRGFFQFQEEPLSLTLTDLKPALLDEPEEEADFAYAQLVLPVAAKYGIDWRLVAAVIQAESGFNAHAVSPKGAVGLMQVMPGTAALYGFKRIELYDPAKNVEAGVRHLKMLDDRYSGDVRLILAAYNSGEKAVDHYHGVPPYKATRQFVSRVLQNYSVPQPVSGGSISGAAAR
jgi:soluble lytic murein transglycosylase-like protein